MDVKTTETHERNHIVVLSKSQLEFLIRDKMLENLNLTVPYKDVKVSWGETSVDSGLRKEVQVIVTVREDLTAKTTVREPERRPQVKASGLGDIECSIPLPSVTPPVVDFCRPLTEQLPPR